MVHNKNVEGTLIQSTTYKITLYVNGKQVNSKTYEPRTSMNLLEVNEPLIIGANLYTSWTVSKKYFKGLIDSIRISGSEKYTAEFTPGVLSADDDTIAFWDFSGNANDSSGNGLDGSATNVTYSTDCKMPLPKCNSSTILFPCKDSSTNYIWSQRYGAMEWQAAVGHCNSLNSSNYGGFSSGWHLPTISELRTLIKNCPTTETNGDCMVTDQCVTWGQNPDGTDCYKNSYCYKVTGDICPTSQEHSLFGDRSEFWSGSYPPDNEKYAWYVNFKNGGVSYGHEVLNLYNVRCVR